MSKNLKYTEEQVEEMIQGAVAKTEKSFGGTFKRLNADIMNEILFTVYLKPLSRQEPGGCVIDGHASFYKKTSQRDYERQLMLELEKYRPTIPFSDAVYFVVENLKGVL